MTASPTYLFLKRTTDLLIAVAALLLLSPLLVPIMLALRLTGEGEVFYRQTRIGYQNKQFTIWKFATMLKNSPAMGTGSLTLRDDPRVTTLGKYLRITKLNEVPQLINLMIGNMTLIGPRPQMAEDFAAYSPEVQSQIYQIKPGITGIGSIIFRDEERLLSQAGRDPRSLYQHAIAPYKGEVELWYQQRMTMLTDLKLLLLTVWAIFHPKSKAYLKIFPDLPPLPTELNADLID